jgi:hypothetical protein
MENRRTNMIKDLISQCVTELTLFDQQKDNSSHNDPDSSHSPGNSSHFEKPKKRVPQDQMRNIIMKICQGKYLTFSEIASLVGREPRAFLNRYLTPMVREGLLKLRFPESPNRPDQAYTSVEQAQ